MAKRRITYQGGHTVYAIVREASTGKAWDVAAAAFETYSGAALDDYDIALADLGGDVYELTLPAGLPGTTLLRMVYYARAGASPAGTDLVVFSEECYSAAVAAEETAATTGAAGAARGNCYGDLAAIKEELSLSAQTEWDATLLRMLAAASRRVETSCGRRFYSWSETRYYQGARGGELGTSGIVVEDLLSISELKTDGDGDYTYGETWVNGTDWQLEPVNEWPKWKIVVDPINGNYTFPTHKRGVKVTGTWGYGDGSGASPWRAAGVNVTVATANGTTATPSGDGLEAGQTILVGSEQMFIETVTTGAQRALTVRRGMNGTTAAAHDGAAASLALYPEEVVEAAQTLVKIGYGMLGHEATEQWRTESYFASYLGSELVDRMLMSWVGALRRISV